MIIRLSSLFYGLSLGCFTFSFSFWFLILLILSLFVVLIILPVSVYVLFTPLTLSLVVIKIIMYASYCSLLLECGKASISLEARSLRIDSYPLQLSRRGFNKISKHLSQSIQATKVAAKSVLVTETRRGWATNPIRMGKATSSSALLLSLKSLDW